MSEEYVPAPEEMWQELMSIAVARGLELRRRGEASRSVKLPDVGDRSCAAQILESFATGMQEDVDKGDLSLDDALLAEADIRSCWAVASYLRRLG